MAKGCCDCRETAGKVGGMKRINPGKNDYVIEVAGLANKIIVGTFTCVMTVHSL